IDADLDMVVVLEIVQTTQLDDERIQVLTGPGHRAPGELAAANRAIELVVDERFTVQPFEFRMPAALRCRASVGRAVQIQPVRDLAADAAIDATTRVVHERLRVVADVLAAGPGDEIVFPGLGVFLRVLRTLYPFALGWT